MKRLGTLVVLLCGLGALVACGSSSNPAFTGSWLFVFTPTGSGTNALQANANLTQNGNQITGSATLSQNGTNCGVSAAISGTVKGSDLTLQIAQETGTIDMTGTANQAFTSISGTYTAAAGPCFAAPSDGSWTGILQ